MAWLSMSVVGRPLGLNQGVETDALLEPSAWELEYLELEYLKPEYLELEHPKLEYWAGSRLVMEEMEEAEEVGSAVGSVARSAAGLAVGLAVDWVLGCPVAAAVKEEALDSQVLALALAMEGRHELLDALALALALASASALASACCRMLECCRTSEEQSLWDR